MKPTTLSDSDQVRDEYLRASGIFIGKVIAARIMDMREPYGRQYLEDAAREYFARSFGCLLVSLLPA